MMIDLRKIRKNAQARATRGASIAGDCKRAAEALKQQPLRTARDAATTSKMSKHIAYELRKAVLPKLLSSRNDRSSRRKKNRIA